MYKTIAETGEFEQVINKSTFIARAFAVKSPEEAVQIVQAERKRYPDARHCCWAYVLGEDKSNLRYSDDSEPQGTAGQPILQVILKKDITNVLVTVTRYFGGILLGAGGLTRAYSSSAAGAIDATGIKTMVLSSKATVCLDYTTFSKIQNTVEKSDYIKIESIEYLEGVTLHLIVQSEDFPRLLADFTQFTLGKSLPKETEKLFLPW
ncbi:MAG: YigZ family protein [Clostridia bacterium]|nr:YigZ family protein [Clostridia bacterium]